MDGYKPLELSETIEALNEIPSGLHSLTLDSITPAMFSYLAAVNQWPVFIFPPCLKIFRARRVPHTMPIPFKELPSSLETFEVAPNFQLFNAGFHVYEQHLLPMVASVKPPRSFMTISPGEFPKSLTHLDYSRNDLTPSDFLKLPPNLTFLQCMRIEDLDVDAFLRHLPQTLRVLRVQGLFLLVQQLALLPRTINEIAVNSIEIDDEFILSLFDEQSDCYKRQKSHPTVLAPKEIIQAAFNLLPIVYHTWKPLPWKFQVTSAVLSQIPERITAVRGLESIQPGNQQPEITMLPPQLTSIHLPKAAYFWPSEGDEELQWPPNLTHLELPVDYSLPPSQIATLPHTLTALLLPWNEALSNADIEALPPNLVHLDLAYNDLINDSAIPLLPRSLTRLSFWNNTKLTGACFEHLPSSLIELTMARARIEAKHFSSLPPNLEILNVGNGRFFDPPDYTVLPKSLHTIIWQWVTPQYHACNAHLPLLTVASSVLSRMKANVNLDEAKFWESHNPNQAELKLTEIRTQSGMRN
jgi:hypothetical protein